MAEYAFILRERNDLHIVIKCLVSPGRERSDSRRERRGRSAPGPACDRGATVPNPRALVRRGACVVVIGYGAFLLGECSGPAYRIDGSSLSWAFTMS